MRDLLHFIKSVLPFRAGASTPGSAIRPEGVARPDSELQKTKAFNVLSKL